MTSLLTMLKLMLITDRDFLRTGKNGFWELISPNVETNS